jgi:hypothetical protein
VLPDKAPIHLSHLIKETVEKSSRLQLEFLPLLLLSSTLKNGFQPYKCVELRNFCPEDLFAIKVKFQTA